MTTNDANYTNLVATKSSDLTEYSDCAEENIIKIIPIGTLTFSENKESAEEFVDFITSDCGKAIYE